MLTAYVSLLPDRVEDALAACRVVRGLSQKEPGCERYDFFQSPDDVARIVFVEEWTTRHDLEVHFQQAAFKEFFATMQPLMSGPPEIRIFESTLETS